MNYNYSIRSFETGESQIEFTDVIDMSALIRSVENELSQIECSLSLANPGGDVYKDEYQLRMNTTCGTAVIDVSEIDETLTIRASQEMIKLLDKLFQQSASSIKGKQ